MIGDCDGDEEYAKRIQDKEFEKLEIYAAQKPKRERKKPKRERTKPKKERKEPKPLEIKDNNAILENNLANNQVVAPASVNPKFVTLKHFGDWNFRFSIIDGISVFVYGLVELYILFSLAALPIIWCYFNYKFSLIALILQMIYLFGTIFLRFGLAIGFRDNLAFTIINCIIIGLDVLYWIFLYKYFKILSSIDSSERSDLAKFVKNYGKETKKSQEEETKVNN